jgi:hypothetical protein
LNFAVRKNWTQIAVEGGSFTVVGTRTARFGGGVSAWVEKSVTGSGQCSVAFFGSNPTNLVQKQCQLLVSTSAILVPPTIAAAPISQTVSAGQSGLFMVAATSTDPLTYQWFKNGVAIAGANASDVLVLANVADVGGTYQITVKVSDRGGSVTSAAAVMFIALPPPTAGGTLITAAEGGEVAGGSTGEEASLYVAPGALSANTTILLTTEPLAPSSLPAGVTAMSDIVEIKPAGLSLLKPASLSFLMKQSLPSDTALVVVRLDANNNVLGQQAQRVGVASARAIPNMKALSVNGRVSASAINLSGGLDCVGGQFVDGASKLSSKAITAAGKFVTLAVPKALCASVAVPASGPVPLDTVERCTEDAQFGSVGNKRAYGLSDDANSLVNRHVDCRTSISSGDNLLVDMLTDVDGRRTRIAPVNSVESLIQDTVASVKFEFQVSTYGPNSGLSKTLSYRVRAIEYIEIASYEGPKKRPKIFLRPKLSGNCRALEVAPFPRPAAFSCAQAQLGVVEVDANGSWSQWKDTTVNFEWTSATDSKYDMVFVEIDLGSFDARIEGTDVDFKRPQGAQAQQLNSDLHSLPRLRCDKGLAQIATKGCVFHEAAAVYVLKSSDPAVSEAAEHIREAQALGSPGKFLLKPLTRAFASTTDSANRGLQRFKNSEDFDKPNNNAACAAPTSIFRTSVVNKSFSCALDPQKCQCDEYPFNSTWQGAAYERSSTSVKLINGRQNLNAGGTTLTNFYKYQRLLDLADYGPLGKTLPLNGGSSDYFWVYVPLAD